MKRHLRTLAYGLISFLFVTVGALWLHAQIINGVKAHVDHSFIIGNTTLPPGEYTFRMMPDTELTVMHVTSENDKTNVEFLVREAIDDHTPSHSELVFRKYGNTEFLNKVFEAGSKTGIEVTETSRQEARLGKQGQHAMPHSEEQK